MTSLIMQENAKVSNGTHVPLLTARSVTKSFGGVHALKGVDIDLWPGEIHVLAGENGSGKSTLLNCLSGGLRPDAGTLRLDGKEVVMTGIRDAMQRGVTRISQELSLVPDMSVAENVFLGHAQGAFTLLDRREMRSRSEEILERLGCRIDVRTPVRRLSADQRQLVEIARALSFESTVLLLDEPTSSLDLEESASLFRTMRSLAESGVAVVFISHRIPEMMAVGDRFTVLRDGELIDSSTRDSVDSSWLVTRMVGRDVSLSDRHPRRPRAEGRPLLTVNNLADRQGRVAGATFEVREGEIVAIAGLVGAGKTELLELIAGVAGRSGGTVNVGGQPVNSSVGHARGQGVALVPQDRKAQGIFPEMTIKTNVMLGNRSTRSPLISPRHEDRASKEWCSTLLIKSGVDTPVSALSGGNQQKVVIARSLQSQPKVLLLDEPTRGVDIGAKVEIYRLVSELADDGLTVMFASSELLEILAVATRVIIMHAGSIAADLPIEGLTEEKIIAIATGVEE